MSNSISGVQMPSREEIAKHSEKYFAPWRDALRHWVLAGCPTGCEAFQTEVFSVLEETRPHGTIVLCGHCDTKNYIHKYPACLDCPYNMAYDGIFEDLAEYFKLQ